MCRKRGAIGGSVFSNPLPNPLLSAVKHPSTTIRISSKVISGPFRPAEFNRNLHLSIALLVVARLARTSPKSESKKFRPHIFIPSCGTNKLQSEYRGGLVLDQFDALNLAVVSIC